ncbi:MAG: hypothetical protein IIV02_04375 [Peptococcaceae bacterium]|nr:hypothetical protein [Peptococcaceae bacterium]
MTTEIACLEDLVLGMTIHLLKSEDRYSILMAKNMTGKYASEKFDTIEEAYEMFERLSKAVVIGLYSWEERKAMLEQG